MSEQVVGWFNGSLPAKFYLPLYRGRGLQSLQAGCTGNQTVASAKVNKERSLEGKLSNCLLPASSEILKKHLKQ